MTIRYDYSELKATRSDEGYLIDSPIVARTGILIYRNADGSVRRELRRPEEVFKTDSLNSFVGKPITVDHPKSLVNHENIEQFQVGTMVSVGRKDDDGKHVRVDTVIHKPNKIGARRQLSAGYNVDLIETPGEWEGERYDAEQTNIRVNHLSVVMSARAGAVARLNFDSNEEPLITELVEMPKIRLDTGIEYEAAPEVIVAVEKLRTDAAALATQVQSKDTEINSLKGAKDTLQARVDGFPAELAKAQETAKAQIADRVKLEATATAFKVDAKDKTDDEVKHAVIKTFNKDFDPVGKSADYVNSAYDFAVSMRKDTAIATQRQYMGMPSTGRTDSVDHRKGYLDSIGSNAVKA